LAEGVRKTTKPLEYNELQIPISGGMLACRYLNYRYYPFLMLSGINAVPFR